MCYAMEGSSGKIRKAAIHRDEVGLRRNLNLYCISQDANQNLQKASSALKENLKLWLSKVKMVSDSIDIFDAKILNLGLYLDISLNNREDKNMAMPQIRNYLFTELNRTTPEIGQMFSIGEVERILNLMPIVKRVNRVQISVKNGEGYSDTRYDIAPNTAPDGSMIYVPIDFIWEIKNSTDITGIVK